MRILVDSQDGGENGTQGSWMFFTRRKKVDFANKSSSKGQLAKELTVPQLMAIGVGATLGASVYVLVGTVDRKHSDLLLMISFLVAGFSAALSAFCYAEPASHCPFAGSAYH